MSELGLPKNLREAVPYIVWGVLVLGFGLEFCAALVHEEWLRASICFVLMCGLAAMTLYSKDVKTWLASTNPNYVAPAFMVLLLTLIFSPYIEQQRWPFAWLFRAAPAPSADEIAEAVAHKLPKANTPIPTPPATAPSFVNPIHEKSVKWDIAQGIRTAIIHGKLNPECHITIVRESDAYADDYATDFKEILYVFNWKVDAEHIGPVNKEITFRAIGTSGPSKDCAEALSESIRSTSTTLAD